MDIKRARFLITFQKRKRLLNFLKLSVVFEVKSEEIAKRFDDVSNFDY